MMPLVKKRSWRAGEGRATPDGLMLPGVYAESYCVFGFDEDVASLKDAVDRIALIMRANPGLALELEASGYEKSIYCTLDGDGEVVGVECLKDLVRLGIFLEIE